LRKNAIPLDPVTLPLGQSVYEFTALSGFPDIVLDSCPDRCQTAYVSHNKPHSSLISISRLLVTVLQRMPANGVQHRTPAHTG